MGKVEKVYLWGAIVSIVVILVSMSFFDILYQGKEVLLANNTSMETLVFATFYVSSKFIMVVFGLIFVVTGVFAVIKRNQRISKISGFNK